MHKLGVVSVIGSDNIFNIEANGAVLVGLRSNDDHDDAAIHVIVHN